MSDIWIPDTKERILAVAERLFAERGYDGTGVQHLAEAAGITKPSLYHFFGSKEGLLEQIANTRYYSLEAILAEDSSSSSSLFDCLIDRAIRMLDWARDHEDLARLYLLMWFSPPGHPGHRAIVGMIDRVHGGAERLFRNLVDRYPRLNTHEALLAMEFLGLVHTTMGARLAGRLDVTPALVRKLIEHFHNGIA